MIISPAEANIARGSSILRDLTEPGFDAVFEASRIKNLVDGAFFFMEGEPADKAYILLEGKVKLGQVTADGQQVILGYLVPGRVFGIIACLKKLTYPVSAQAVERCKAIYWDQETMNSLMNKHPRIGLNAMHIMAGQIREFQNTIRDLSTKRVEQRIARAVLRLARQSGRKIENGVLIDLPLTRQDLAEMTGTTLFTVSRVLKDWEKQDLVQSKRLKVIITFPHGLVAIAEDLPDNGRKKPEIPDDLCDLNP